MMASPKGNAMEMVPVVGISRDKKQSLATGTELFLSYGKTYCMSAVRLIVLELTQLVSPSTW
jgi:hypothetical protein